MALFVRLKAIASCFWQNVRACSHVDQGCGGGRPPRSYVDLKRGMRKDYFEKALPWPSKGSDVKLPL